MAQMLTDMNIEEVSLVDDPANPGAQVLLWKRKNGGDMTKKDDTGLKTSLLQVLTKFGLYGAPEQATTFNQLDDGREKQEMIQVLCDSLVSIAGDSSISDEEKKTYMQQSVSEFLAEMGTGTETEKGNSDDPAAMQTKGDMMKGTIDLSTLSKENKEQLLKQLQDEQAAAGSTGETASNEGGDAMQKEQVDEMVTKALEPVQKQLKDAQDLIAKMNEEKASSVRLEKAKEITKGLAGVEAEKVAEMLKGLDDAGQETLAGILKAAGEQAKLSTLLKTSGSDAAKPGSAAEIAKSKADEIRKSNPKLTEQQAMAQVWEQNPKLYEQHCGEQA